MPSAVVFGCSGPVLNSEERKFFADADPWGFILFSRNAVDPQQLVALVGELRSTVARKAPVFIDQEGGRVARLGAPHWREWPPVGKLFSSTKFDAHDCEEMLGLRFRTIATELISVGVDVNCVPVLDLPVPGAHPVIGDRALGSEPRSVGRRGEIVCRALLAGGVLPVIKHIPGHGRASSDSHAELPVVEATRNELSKTDFEPFRALAEMPIAMTAHVAYRDIDASRPATQSPSVIREVVRGDIGFEGVLLSDDLGMDALPGPLAKRAETALLAGCDIVLHCDGCRAGMQECMNGIGPVSGEALKRLKAAEARRTEPGDWDAEVAETRLTELTARWKEVANG